MSYHDQQYQQHDQYAGQQYPQYNQQQQQHYGGNDGQGQYQPPQQPPQQQYVAPQPVPQEFNFTISSSNMGQYSFTLTHQDSLTTLYNRVYDRYRADDAYLKYADLRLPNSPAPISQFISTSIVGTIFLDLITSSLDDVVTIKYMCEKCGHIVCFFSTILSF